MSRAPGKKSLGNNKRNHMGLPKQYLAGHVDRALRQYAVYLPQFLTLMSYDVEQQSLKPLWQACLVTMPSPVLGIVPKGLINDILDLKKNRHEFVQMNPGEDQFGTTIIIL